MTSAQVVGISAEVSRARSRYLCENSLLAENENPVVYSREAADSSLRWSLLACQKFYQKDLISGPCFRPIANFWLGANAILLGPGA